MSTAAQDFLAANIAAWPSHCPPLTRVDRGRVLIERQGAWQSLSANSDGHWVTLHSRRDPIREAENTLDEHCALESRVLFVIGLGLGYLLDALERRGWSGRVVAFEPDPAVVDALLQRRDWRPWLESGGLTILFGPQYTGLSAVVRALIPKTRPPIILQKLVAARVSTDTTHAAVRLSTASFLCPAA